MFFRRNCAVIRTPFVTELNTTGTGLVYSSFLGGGKASLGYGIALDTAGDAYVIGFTNSPGFPTVNPISTYDWGSAGRFRD